MKNLITTIFINLLLITLFFGNDWRTDAQNIRSNRKSANNLQNNLGLRNRNGNEPVPSNLEINQYRPSVPNQRRGRQRHGNRQALRLLSDSTNYQRSIIEHGPGGLWPKPFNTALKAKITANATCGQDGPEEYCRMTDIYHPRIHSQCGICDANDPEFRHPITNAIDGTHSWWQSPTLAEGKQYEYVTIDIDLGQIYEIFSFKIKASESAVPAAWILEKSLDGEIYTPWQYFALNDDECVSRYNLSGHNANYIFKYDNEVICSTEFAEITRLKYGEVKVVLFNGRPSANSSFSSELLQFTLTRHIRVRFQGFNREVLNYESQKIKWEVGEDDLEIRTFYSIQSIIAHGRCHCSGHAAKCRENDIEENNNLPQCECLHNTCGKYCEKCCPLYNQRPYRVGTMGRENRCEKCECHGHATECRYSSEVDQRNLSMNTRGKMIGGGVCINCTKFTTGINCEKCLPNYYRPYNRPPDAETPCVPCECNPVGSIGSCNIYGGECTCKEGFTGPQCDKCAVGYQGENCTKCACDIRGTMAGGECESECHCKHYVEEETCNQCIPGYFSLNYNNPEGCLKCYCSGVGTSCKSKMVFRNSIETLEGWTVTDIAKLETAYPVRDNDTGMMVFGMYELPETEAVYWSAPKMYLGNRLESYGSHFIYKIHWVVVRGDTSGKPTSGPKLILIGKNGLKIAYGDGTMTGSNATVDVLLTEENFYHVPREVKDIVTRLRRTEYRGDPVTRTQFMSVLSDIDTILLRGTYHTDQAESILEKATLFTGNISKTNEVALHDENFNFVEECDCPPGYTGLSCESCIFGYIRIYENSTSHEKITKCIQCDCNNHAETCVLDKFTSTCGECSHNTFGERCEKCKSGFYGNATIGTPHDCKPCGCPLVDESNNFSPTCIPKEFDPQQYICSNCAEGHIGDHCEYCADGYYGEPTVLGSKCIPCPCNEGPCDRVTGHCIECLGNTEGWRCERCKPGFWGNPKDGCNICECHDSGAINNLCDPETGKCFCKTNYKGDLCDHCENGFTNITADCPSCGCHFNGSESVICDAITGQCTCKLNVEGLKCDTCSVEYFGLSEEGCEGCNCHISGSIDRICDFQTGQCKCHPHVHGRRCDRCEQGYWNIDSKQGCDKCVCNVNGSEDSNCDSYSGQCFCKTGVEGLTCDRCQPGYYGFSPKGCKKCDICTSNAHVCDPDTGRCICPPYSRGADCQQCFPNTWGYEFQKGCKQCECNSVGSAKQDCDVYTGQCHCKEGFAGRKCEYCAPGHFSYPNCHKCNCDQKGSMADENGVIHCDDYGQCPCKNHVTGAKCDQCKSSTFGLSASNTDGCIRCFCFGRTQHCQESQMHRGQIRMMGPRNVTVKYITNYRSTRQDYEFVYVSHIKNNKIYREAAEIKNVNGLNILPSPTGNVTIGSNSAFYYPLYFQLPKKFLGDKITSYGGYLNFSILTEGCSSNLRESILRQFPVVQLHTHHKLILDYYETEDTTSLLRNYNVQFHESKWRYHFNNFNITRGIFITALQNIKHIFLRGTTAPDFTEVILANVSLDIGLPANGNRNSDIATEVEVCDCPEKFMGSSCQNAAEGYYRYRNVTESTILEELVGFVVPCECNGRSDSCDPETGECQNCQDYTGGHHCEKCAEGYFGDPSSGCEPCPCPETNKKFSRGCFVHPDGSVNCYCKDQYTGPLCNRCKSGYFGYPNSTDGSCEPCECNPDGIVSDECHDETGQCNCKPGVIGRKCDRCELPRHLLQDRRCQLCDKCSLTLMDKIDEIRYDFESSMDGVSLHDLRAPWLRLNAYYNQTELLDGKTTELFNAIDRVDGFKEIPVESMSNRAAYTFSRSGKFSNKAEKSLTDVENVEKNADAILIELSDIESIIRKSIIELQNYGSHDNHMKLPIAIREANDLLSNIQMEISEKLSSNSFDVSCVKNNWEFWNRENNATEKQKNDLENLKHGFLSVSNRLQDMQSLIHNTFKNIMETEVLLTYNQKNFDKLQENIKKIDEMNAEINEALDMDLAAETESLMESVEANMKSLDHVNDDLITLNDDLNMTIQECHEGLHNLKMVALPKAKEHSRKLAQKAKIYVDLFQHSKDGAKVALDASTAHSNIAKAVEEARIATNLAYEAAKNSNDELNPVGEYTIAEKGLDSKHESLDIRNDAIAEITRIEDLTDKVEYQEHLVESIRNTVRQAGLKNNELTSKLNTINDEETMNSIKDSLDAAGKISQEMSELGQESNNINSDIYKLKLKLSNLDPEWDSKFGLAEENISQSERNIKLSKQEIVIAETRVNEQHERFQVWNSSFSSKLQELRDKIARAKHAAEGIRISIESSEGKCQRSYLPVSIGPTTSTSIVMTIALNTKNGNTPLVFIQGEDRKFIALEMVKRKIYMFWNLGDDVGVVSHPMEIQTRDPKYDDSWYKIEANRTMNIGSLIVRRMNNNGQLGNAPIVTNATSINFTRLTFDSNSRIWVGGVPDYLRPSVLSKRIGLGVVLHQLVVDHTHIGLWNFASSEGSCGGAIEGAFESSISLNSRHFNGQGYAVLQRSSSRPYRKNSFFLRMTFKTLDENALLFLTVDEKNNRSVSLTLYEGKVIFRIDYGGESHLEINTTKRFNTGKWVNVEAAREFLPKRNTENGSLKVNNDDAHTGAPTKPVNSNLLPDLSEAMYYLGGVPPGFKTGTTKAPGADHPFLGCLKDVQVNGEAYDPMQSQRYYGVEATCKETIIKAGFPGNGYVEIPSHSLKKRANFGFVFRTLQPEALLLLSAYPPQSAGDYDVKDIRGNYSVALMNGRIHVWVDAGKGRVELESNLTLNDGEYHVVSVSKTGRRFELRINDELQSTKTLSATPALVNMPEESGGLFLGGAPDFPEFDDLSPTFIGLQGSIKSIVFNNRTVSFDRALNFKNVHMGGDGPQMGGAAVQMMEPQKIFKDEQEGCQRVGSYSYEPNAFKFGDKPDSHSVVYVPTRHLWQKNFKIDFDFRTFYPNGLLFVSPGAKDKQKHYILLYLKDGKLNLKVKARKKIEMMLPVILNDGMWHHVSLNCVNRKTTLSVKIGNGYNTNQTQIKLPKKLGASNTLYVGSIPPDDPNGIASDSLSLPKELIAKVGIFKGCMRRFAVNDLTQDLARRHHNVGQCFPRVEKGSYFPGDAYAIYAHNFNINKIVEIQLQFRTSELNGILFSVSDPTGSPALSLELFNGKVVLSCDLGNGQPFRVETQLDSKFALCDNKWHSIMAHYESEQIILGIDGETPIEKISPNLAPGFVRTSAPLFIGGLPDIAPSGTLLSRENFKGCIRNVVIRNTIKDWTDMAGLHNVLLHECISISK